MQRKDILNDKITVMDKVEATLSKWERFNPYQTGHGVIGDTKYNRSKQKEQDKKFILNDKWDN